MASDPLGMCGSMGSTFARGCIGASTRSPRARKPSRWSRNSPAPAESWLPGVRGPLRLDCSCARAAVAPGCSRGQHVRRFQYPSRLTLAWRLASRIAGPSTNGGRFVCWPVGTTSISAAQHEDSLPQARSAPRGPVPAPRPATCCWASPRPPGRPWPTCSRSAPGRHQGAVPGPARSRPGARPGRRPRRGLRRRRRRHGHPRRVPVDPIRRRAREARAALDPWRDERPVKELDEQVRWLLSA